MIKCGANPRLSGKNNPLHLAVQTNKRLVKWLLEDHVESSDWIQAKNDLGMKPIDLAESLKSIAQLLRHSIPRSLQQESLSIDIKGHKPPIESTPLCDAIKYKNIELVNSLLLGNRISPNAIEKSGRPYIF